MDHWILTFRIQRAQALITMKCAVHEDVSVRATLLSALAAVSAVVPTLTPMSAMNDVDFLQPKQEQLLTHSRVSVLSMPLRFLRMLQSLALETDTISISDALTSVPRRELILHVWSAPERILETMWQIENHDVKIRAHKHLDGFAFAMKSRRILGFVGLNTHG